MIQAIKSHMTKEVIVPQWSIYFLSFVAALTASITSIVMSAV